MMAPYIAKQILDGKVSYEKAFSSTLYKKYQSDVDSILIMEGREDLIVRA